MRAPWNWIAFLVACMVVGVVGCLLTDAVLMLFGVFDPAAYWRVFAGDVRLTVVISVAFGASIFLYETMRFKVERAMLEEERARQGSTGRGSVTYSGKPTFLRRAFSRGSPRSRANSGETSSQPTRMGPAAATRSRASKARSPLESGSVVAEFSNGDSRRSQARGRCQVALGAVPSRQLSPTRA
jgi:hypothetical protein